MIFCFQNGAFVLNYLDGLLGNVQSEECSISRTKLEYFDSTTRLARRRETHVRNFTLPPHAVDRNIAAQFDTAGIELPQTRLRAVVKIAHPRASMPMTSAPARSAATRPVKKRSGAIRPTQYPRILP